ncbi:MAG: carboxypeptidase-like regulatory domain-containing protein, partial [Planctomycetota bacterium]
SDAARDTSIWVFDSMGNEVGFGRITSAEFGFSKIPAGELHVIAMARDPRGLVQADLTLRAGEVKRAELTLQVPDTAIEGRVVDAQGRGVPGIRLTASNVLESFGLRTALDWIEASTDAQGHFRLEPVYAGTCEVGAEDVEGPMPITVWPPRRKLMLDAASIATGVDFRAEPSVRYFGSIAPIPAIDDSHPVFLELVHAEFGWISTDFTEDGTFEFFAMPGVDYVLIAKQNHKEIGRVAVSHTGSRNLILPIGP